MGHTDNPTTHKRKKRLLSAKTSPSLRHYILQWQKKKKSNGKKEENKFIGIEEHPDCLPILLLEKQKPV